MTTRRSFLKVLLGGVAVAAVPAMPTPPAAAAVTWDAANWLEGDCTAPHVFRDTLLALTVREGGARETLLFPMHADAWQLSEDDVATYGERIEVTAERLCTIEGRFDILDAGGRCLARGEITFNRGADIPLCAGDTFALLGVSIRED
jgi:hypothetical protein